MKFFLTSSYSKYPNVANKLLELIKEEPKNMTVAFIPTAAHFYEDKWFVEADRNKLIEQGFKIKEINLESKNQKELEEEILDCSIIFVCGGNTFYLLQEARKSGFDKVLDKFINKEIIYIGSSAGSVLVGPDIEIIKFLDDPIKTPEIKDYKGLSLIDFVIIPHYEKEKYEDKYKQLMDEAILKDLQIKTLRDDEYVIV